MLFKVDILTEALRLLDLEDLDRMRAFYELRRQQFLNGPLTRMGEITYSNFEMDGVAKSILPLNRLDVRKGEKAIPVRYH